MYFNKLLDIKSEKKFHLKLPQELINPNLFKHFLAGFMDTDGYFSGTSFGIMLNGTNKNLLENIIKLSNEFYGIEYRKLCENTLIQNGKEMKRVMINTKSSSRDNFRRSIPLRNKKYGSGRS